MRRRWIQINGELIDAASVPDAAVTPDAGALWGDSNDYDGLRASDGTMIDTRTKHRAYMRRHGITTADDYQEHWQKMRRERDEFYTSGSDHAQRREAVEKAITKGRNG